MVREAEHHKSKRKVYDILLVPADDATQAKKLRLPLFAIILIGLGSTTVLFLIVASLLAYTPMGKLIPFGGGIHRQEFAQQIEAINTRIATLMEELVRLRTYNSQLRQALGEQTGKDSARTAQKPISKKEARAAAPKVEAGEREQHVVPAQIPGYSVAGSYMQYSSANQPAAVFPAIVPAEGYLSRGFDPGQRHYAVDFAGKTGSSILAAADGHVVFAGFTVDDGYMLIISHAGGFMTFYKHCQSLLVEANSYVKRGATIARLGNTGRNSYGPHLHFELWKDGSPVNPALYLMNLNM